VRRAAAAAAIALALAACARTGEPGAGALPAPRSAPNEPVLPIAVVPQPRAVRRLAGAYVWPAAVRIAASGDAAAAVAPLAAYLEANGVRALRVPLDARQRDAEVRVETTPPRRDLGDEGYELAASHDGVLLRAHTAAGAFYALQTLEQLSSRGGGQLRTAAAVVTDRPEYRWRGLHVDVARHFFPVPVLERLIDAAAHYKLNVLHLHLTDEGAWRLSSARYPSLASPQRYAPADVRALAAYASRRAMIVVPELDLPAHAGAARRALPRLDCGAVLCTGAAGLGFARAVLGDAAAAFGTPYVHAGVDEVPAAHAVDARRFASALAAQLAHDGRRLVVWDDTLANAVPPRAIVTVWTSRARAAALAARGADVVVASAPLYFDAAQGDPAQEPPATRYMATLREVYDAGVEPRGLATGARAHVLGAEACLWTERIATPDRLFAMAFPRTLALAEIAWTPRGGKDWDGFVARLPAQLRWLDAHGDAFRIPNVTFAVRGAAAAFDAVPGAVQSVRVRTTAPAVTIALRVPLDGAAIRYTTDGSAPAATSRAYAAPLTVLSSSAGTRVRAAAFYRGARGAATEAIVTRVAAAALRAHPSRSRSWDGLVSP
jgi:hexosaminidase